MAKKIQGTGQYKAPNGEGVQFSFEYDAFDSLQDAVASLGESTVLTLVQRMTKLDAANTTREKVKVANGHSVRKPMSEEEKAEAKADRQANKTMLDAIRAKGISSVEDLRKLLNK